MRTFIIVAAFATSLASPVLARPASSGSDNVIGFSYGPATRQHKTASHESSPHYYDMVSRTPSTFNPNSAAETGGGSLGYNETLLRD
jgi:hypothetical protein